MRRFEACNSGAQLVAGSAQHECPQGSAQHPQAAPAGGARAAAARTHLVPPHRPGCGNQLVHAAIGAPACYCCSKGGAGAALGQRLLRGHNHEIVRSVRIAWGDGAVQPMLNLLCKGLIGSARDFMKAGRGATCRRGLFGLLVDDVAADTAQHSSFVCRELGHEQNGHPTVTPRLGTTWPHLAT